MKTLTHDDISRMSAPERLSLIAELWDSIPDAEVPVLPAQRQELDRRLASFDQDRAHAVPWDKLKAALAARAS